MTGVASHSIQHRRREKLMFTRRNREEKSLEPPSILYHRMSIDLLEKYARAGYAVAQAELEDRLGSLEPFSLLYRGAPIDTLKEYASAGKPGASAALACRLASPLFSASPTDAGPDAAPAPTPQEETDHRSGLASEEGMTRIIERLFSLTAILTGIVVGLCLMGLGIEKTVAAKGQEEIPLLLMTFFGLLIPMAAPFFWLKSASGRRIKESVAKRIAFVFRWPFVRLFAAVKGVKNAPAHRKQLYVLLMVAAWITILFVWFLLPVHRQWAWVHDDPKLVYYSDGQGGLQTTWQSQGHSRIYFGYLTRGDVGITTYDPAHRLSPSSRLTLDEAIEYIAAYSIPAVLFGGVFFWWFGRRT